MALANPELTSDRPLGALKSPKSRLQEYTQRLSRERPQYRLVDAVGPDHDKVFRIEVAVGGRVIGVGEGHSRRVAETEAAAHGLETLRRDSEEAADGSVQAPELAEFLGEDGETDTSDWGIFEEGRRAGDRPWTEFDLETLGLADAEPAEQGQPGPTRPNGPAETAMTRKAGRIRLRAGWPGKVGELIATMERRAEAATVDRLSGVAGS